MRPEREGQALPTDGVDSLLFNAEEEWALPHLHVVGFFAHLLVGQGFALGYAATFALLDRATWWLGALLGLLHAATALAVLVPLLPGIHPRMASHRAGPRTLAVLEPPGLAGLNYGVETPAVTLAAHLVYGVALGLLLAPH